MSNNRARWGQGYASYRYGTGRKKPIKLAPILSPKERIDATAKVSEILRNWTYSPFENEASCRHGLRQFLCTSGFGWEHSDQEAARVVREALLANGAERPSWEEGQREYLLAREQCKRCGRDLDDEQIGFGDRFCSAHCAKAAREDHAYEGLARESHIWQHASEVLRRAARPVLDCANCGKSFQTRGNRDDAKFCSKACFAEFQTVPPRQCAHCGQDFKAHSLAAKFCSRTCSSASNARGIAAALAPCVCIECRKEFKPTKASTAYCSSACRSRASRRRIANGQPPVLVPLLFDRTFRANPWWLTPARFDAMVGA